MPSRNALAKFLLFLLALVAVLFSHSETVNTQSAPRGALRLRVRVKQGDTTRGLGRKRFFLIRGGLQQNENALTANDQLQSRDCFYQRAGASTELIRWLKENDCETVYCRELQQQDIDGPAAVPEFVKAVAAGEKQFGTRGLGLKWAMVNLPDALRIGFYNLRAAELQRAIKTAEAASGSAVLSVMTDRNGTAYFTDLEPGVYTLSNLVPIELQTTMVNWTCEVQVKQGDLAHEKPYLISNNQKERNVKCVAVEKPLPPCT